jgi:cell division protein FtsZ
MKSKTTKLKNKKHKPVKIAKKSAKKVLVVKKKIKVNKSIKIKKVQKKKSIVRQKTKKTEVAVFEAESFFKAKIKVIGIGGGGGSIVSEIGRSLEKATFVVADTDTRALLKKKSGIKYFHFGETLTRGLGTGANPQIAKQAAELEKDKIEKLFKDQDIVILIASLGGGLGSGATEIFAKAASSFGSITLGIFTLPFKFEGKNKTKIALKALKDLRQTLNVSLTIPNEKIFKIISPNTPIISAFSVVNKNLIESLESLIDLIYNPGLINIDFADLRTILRGKGNLAFLNTIEESGKDRAEQIASKILHNPLYENNNFVAEKILFNISGPSDVSMFEIEKISKGISDVNPKAKIIFGISKNPKSKNKIKTTLLMTGRNKSELTKISAKEVVVEKIKEKEKKPEKDLPIKKEKLKVEKIPASLVFGNENVLDKVASVSMVKKIVIDDLSDNLPEKITKKIIRRNAVEIKEAQAEEEIKKLAQEEEWEVPAFLRKVKYKN